jgi:hypothetical protein
MKRIIIFLASIPEGLHANGGRLLQGTKAILGGMGEVVFKHENSPFF